MYRPSANPPRTAWALHLDQVMRERGWSRVRLFEEIGGELGYSPKSRSALLPILEDKEPTPAQVVVLIRHFGEPLPVPPAPTGPTETPDALITALTAQTQAITALVGELQLWRTEDRVRLAVVERTAERLVERLLLAPEVEVSPTR